VVDVTKLSNDPYAKRNLEREGSLLSKLDHPNIVRLLEIIATEKFYCLVLQYMPGSKDLASVILQGPLPEDLASNICRQLVSALVYMHSANILHRDLKPENILLSTCLRKCLLIDFGLSNLWRPGQVMKTHCGSAEFAAPELFQRDPHYGTGIDVWSFGVVLFCMLLGRVPFEQGNLNIQTLIQKVLAGLTELHYSQMKHLSHGCVGLITACLNPNRHMRISFQEIAAHPWITGNGTHQVEPGLPSNNAEILQQAVQVFLQKVKLKLNVPKNMTPSRFVLDYISRRPFNTTGGCFNLITQDIRQAQTQAESETTNPSRSREPAIPAKAEASRAQHMRVLKEVENLPHRNRRDQAEKRI